MTTGTNPPSRPVRGYSALELQPFDLTRESLARILEVDLPPDEQEGRVVALRVTSRALEKEWAAHAAIAIAGAWVSEGARVLLVDLFLDNPHLHRAFGARNLEGISDAIDYGTSLRRIARPASKGGFWVVTAGTPVADSRALFGQPRWRHLVESLVGRGVTLVTCQPAESPVQPRAAPSIVLACKGEPMKALGKVGLRDAVALLGPRPGRDAAVAVSRQANGLGAQSYQASLWHDVDEEVAAREQREAAAALAAAEAATLAAESRHRPRGRALSVAAFTVLMLFAALMTLLGVHNAGIADVPAAGWLMELFGRLLDWISQFFV